MSEELPARLTIPEQQRAHVSWLEAEVGWFARAFVWSLLGSTIVSYVYLFRRGPRFLEDSDAPARTYSWVEYVLAPFATILNPIGFVILVGWAVLALLPARLLIRQRNLGRSTLFASAVVSICILIGSWILRELLSIFGPFIVVLPLPVLGAALLACRFWPGAFFRLRNEA